MRSKQPWRGVPPRQRIASPWQQNLWRARGGTSREEGPTARGLTRHRFLEEQTSSIIWKVQLVSADLCQCLDAQEEGKRLMLIIEGTHHGEGLDFSTLINTPIFEDICLHLLHSGSEQKLMVKYSDLDLSCLDEEDVPEQNAEVEGANGLEKIGRDVDKAAGSKMASGQITGLGPEHEAEGCWVS